MTSLRDLLTWYNNKDTRPFIEAQVKQCNFYKTLSLDMLKDDVIPGLTLRYLFKTMTKKNFFSLIREKNKDLHAAAKTSCWSPCHYFSSLSRKRDHHASSR